MNSSSTARACPLTCCISLVFLVLAGGCQGWRPSNTRDWSPDQAILPYAEIEGDRARIYNVRNCSYSATDVYEVRHYNKTYDLNKIRTVDFIVVPFSGMPELAHTFLSFGFEGEEYVAISVEIRKEQGEGYSPVGGLTNKYEIMYVVGDERDLIGLRSNFRLDDVYIYRARAEKEQVRAVFLDMLQRTNQLAEKPEFYHLISNNCTTNVARHVNRISPNRVPTDYRVLLPGYSDRLAYDLGLVVGEETFELTRQNARANKLAYVYRDSPEFSAAIRR